MADKLIESLEEVFPETVSVVRIKILLAVTNLYVITKWFT